MSFPEGTELLINSCWRKSAATSRKSVGVRWFPYGPVFCLLLFPTDFCFNNWRFSMVCVKCFADMKSFTWHFQEGANRNLMCALATSSGSSHLPEAEVSFATRSIIALIYLNLCECFAIQHFQGETRTSENPYSCSSCLQRVWASTSSLNFHDGERNIYVKILHSHIIS